MFFLGFFPINLDGQMALNTMISMHLSSCYVEETSQRYKLERLEIQNTALSQMGIKHNTLDAEFIQILNNFFS